jgi:cytochrome b/b6/petD-like protein
MSHNPSPGRESGLPQVVREEKSLPYWEMLFRETIAIELLASVLVWIALWWNAPLELLADPQQTPKLAKAPWYFTGLQELLHYFPPFVAGIILPTLIVVALIVVPFFNVNIKDENLWVHHKPQRLAILSVILLALTILLVRFGAWDALVPAWIIAIFMGIAAASQGRRDKGFRSWLSAKPLSFWIMTWFLMEAVVLTSVGTFFRGPGWTWVLPW